MQTQRIDSSESETSVLTRFSALMLMYWAGMSTHFTFRVLIMKEYAFSDTTVGLISALGSLVIMFAQPIWGMVSDMTGSIKKVILFCLGFSIICYLLLSVVRDPIFFSIIFSFFVFFQSPTDPLLNNWVVQKSKRFPNLWFGRIRLWGSVGFALSAVFFSWLIDHGVSVRLMPVGYALLVGIVGIIAFSTQDVHLEKKERIPLKQLGVMRLFKNYYYVCVFLFSLIVFIPFIAFNTFIPQIVLMLGGNVEQLGWVFFIMAASEVPIFYYAKKLSRSMSPVRMMIFGAVINAVRMTLYLTAKSPVHVILLQSLQGPFFAFFLNGIMHYIDDIAPSKLKSTALTIAISAGFGLGGTIGNAFGGHLIDLLGFQRFFYVCAFISVSITLLFALAQLVGKKMHFQERIDPAQPHSTV